MKWVFCDIETFSVRKNAVIPSLGILSIEINDEALDYTYKDCLALADSVKLDMDEQLTAGRHIMKETMDWWSKQDKAALASVTPDGSEVSILEFHKWLDQFGDIKNATWWFRGPHFDAAIMESLFEDFNIRAPWNFWAVRDTRTWFECYTDHAKIQGDPPKAFVAHDPKHDVALDCWSMLQVMKERMRD